MHLLSLVVILIIAFMVIQDLMNGLEEESNINSIKVHCLKPRTIFSDAEEIMNDKSLTSSILSLPSFLLSLCSRQNYRMASKISATVYTPRQPGTFECGGSP